MQDVDFDKITKVMKLLNWKWLGNPDVPTQEEMIKMCERLFKNAKNDYKLTGDSSESSSGWFEVRVDKWYVAVNFILDENYYGRGY